MQRLFLVVVIAGAIMLGLYYVSNRPVAQMPPPPVPRVAVPPPTPIPAPQVTPPVATPTPTPTVSKTADRQIAKNQYYTLGKLKLELRRLFRNQEFKNLNPGITAEGLLRGQFPANKVRFPGTIPLTFELGASCLPHPDGLKMTKKERNLQALGFPVFVEGRTQVTALLSAVSDRLQKETCIKLVTIDYTIDIRANNKKPDVDQVSRQLADYTLTNFAARGDTPHYLVLGTYSELLALDRRFYKADPAADQLVESRATYLTAANKPINVIRRGLQLSERYEGRVTKTNVAIGIIRALKNNANVIAFNLSEFEPGDLDSAIAFAKSKGAVVVNNVPIPTTTDQSYAQSTIIRTPSPKTKLLKNTIDSDGKGNAPGKGNKGGHGKGAGKGKNKNKAPKNGG